MALPSDPTYLVRPNVWFSIHQSRILQLPLMAMIDEVLSPGIKIARC